MSELTLVVGDKHLSSWSMRPLLALRLAGAKYREIVVKLDRPDTAEQIARHSPSGKVPVLKDGDLTVWDSLAIVEYVAEKFPGLWPADPKARAMARSACAEMHAGFAEMRKTMTMNTVASTPLAQIPPAVARDVERVQELWRECRAAHGAGGPYLFGTFSLADCYFAPVVTRFVTYAPPVAADTRVYMDAVLAHPVVAQWLREARDEAA
jgi:glutathione S-transferase